MARIGDFVQIPKTRTFSGKRYTLKDSFVGEGTAKQLKARYVRQGYSVRIHQQGGAMHFFKRFHVYVRKGK